MSTQKQTDTGNMSLETTLREQTQRLIGALREERTLDATPIMHDDEAHTSEDYITLIYEFHHVILPALENEGLVKFDRDSDTVTRGPRFTERRSVSTDSADVRSESRRIFLRLGHRWPSRSNSLVYQHSIP